MHDWRLLQQLNSQHSSSVVLASCNYVLLLKPKFALLATLEILQLAKSAWTTFMERTARSSAKGNGTAPEMVGARESMGAVCAMRDSRERPVAWLLNVALSAARGFSQLVKNAWTTLMD